MAHSIRALADEKRDMLWALVDALHTARVAFDAADEDGENLTASGAAQTAAADALATAIAEVTDDAAILHGSAAHLPGDMEEAIIQSAAVSALLAAAEYAATEAQVTQDRLDDELGRVRRECARLIIGAWDETTHGKKPSDTALDKLAGDHLVYIAHREAIVAAKERTRAAHARVGELTRRHALLLIMAGRLPGHAESAAEPLNPVRGDLADLLEQSRDLTSLGASTL